MQRRKITAFHHCHSGKILVVIRKDYDSCLTLLTEAQNLTADLMSIMLGQVLKTNIILPIGLRAVITGCARTGFQNSVFQKLASITVLVSSSAGMDSNLLSLFIQNAAHSESVCIGKTDTAYPCTFCHSFLGCAGILILLLHRNI